MDLLPKTNVSFYTIPACWLTCLMARFFAVSQYRKATSKQMDNRYPRGFKDQVAEDQGLDSKTRGRIVRAEAAVLNGFENLPLFAAAVVAGNLGKVDTPLLNALSIGFVVLRVIYNHVYIFNETKALAHVRTGTYMVGLGMCFTLFISAGRNLNKTLL